MASIHFSTAGLVSNTIKVVTIVGVRPQFIETAVVTRAIQEHGIIEEQIAHTGQYYDAGLSDVFFDELKIPKPIHNLSNCSGAHGQQTGTILVGI